MTCQQAIEVLKKADCWNNVIGERKYWLGKGRWLYVDCVKYCSEGYRQYFEDHIEEDGTLSFMYITSASAWNEAQLELMYENGEIEE